jgi:hypothetical protein
MDYGAKEIIPEKKSAPSRLSQPVPDNHAYDSRVKDHREVLPDLIGHESQTIKLRYDQHNQACNKEQVTELGF